MHEQALAHYVDGLNYRRIGRVLGIDHQTISNWVAAHTDSLPDAPPVPGDELSVNELDEVFTFVGRKNEVYVVTNVDRASRCVVGWVVVWQRSHEALQAMLDRSPLAKQYYSDAFGVYETLVYFPGRWRAYADKSQTYSVEADNAELRHYLARLARQSRCFSRSIHALWRSIKLFVFAWNRRQLYKRAFPKYPAHVRDFVYP